MSRVVITVDGLAASGKSSLARALADKLGFVFFSTGILYRALGLILFQKMANPDSEAEACSILSSSDISLALDKDKRATVMLAGKTLGSEIFTPEVSDYTSRSSRHKLVREKLIFLQRESFKEFDIVIEGRDVGTVVFPKADLKLFISASEQVRSERRLRQMKRKGEGSDPKMLEKLVLEIKERDARDQNRENSPTLAAPDAVLIDNSSLSFEESLGKVLELCRSRGLLRA